MALSSHGIIGNRYCQDFSEDYTRTREEIIGYYFAVSNNFLFWGLFFYPEQNPVA
jgi:hypothetical protein